MSSQSPWGKKPQEGPPDLLHLIRRYIFGDRSHHPADQHPSEDNGAKKFFLLLGLGLSLLWVISGFFLVSPAEQSVVLRFGQYQETVGPGPHWIPRLIASKTTLNVQQVNNFSYQAEMLTEDENIVSVALAIQYRIDDPRAFLFNVVDPITTLQQATSSALRQVVGDMTLDAVLTKGRQQLRDAVSKQLSATLAHYNTGLIVTDVALQPAKPPEAVTHAFDDAIKAREDEQRYVNQANAYARRVESTVKGQVARYIQSANAYQQEVVLRAKGKTARYLANLQPYLAAPRVTRERLYLDAMTNVLTHTKNVIVDTSGHAILYFPVSHEPGTQIPNQPQSFDEKMQPLPVQSQLLSGEAALSSDTANPHPRPSYSKGRQHEH